LTHLQPLLGLLDPPVNVSIISFTYSLIHFVWNPPFTLQISENTSRILYEVTIMTPANGNDTLSIMVPEPEYIYHRRDFVHCGKITLNVAAINEVGQGNKSIGIEASFLGRKYNIYIWCS
jgi:hypothetical protein